jgi:hypothetical protein
MRWAGLLANARMLLHMSKEAEAESLSVDEPRVSPPTITSMLQ